MGRLTRAEILSLEDLQTEEVEVPEWGGTVIARGFTGADRDQYEMSLVDINKSSVGNIVARTENMRAKMVARGVVDENGVRIFSEEDVQLLGQKSGAALDRVCDVIKRLSGMTAAAEAEAVKNLSGVLGDVSISA